MTTRAPPPRARSADAPDALLDVFAWTGLLRARPTDAAREELARAAATLSDGAGGEDGAAGLLAIAVALRGAGALLGDGALTARAQHVAAGAMDERAWPHRSVETPGLRDGLAGIGLGCLALAQREPPPLDVRRDRARALRAAQAGDRADVVETGRRGGARQSSRRVEIRASMT